MLLPEYLDFLRTQKNLLAFSGGSDSTALFFLLVEANIDFDIALVNYQTRAQSDDEATYAKTLASEHQKQCHIKVLSLSTQNFEHQAREARYHFFEALTQEHHYTTVLTAHHLGDRLEWFLMQLTKGAGLPELLGMQGMTQQKHYTLVRPLLHLQKEELVAFLDSANITYFHDSSNDDESYKRNHFRHNFAQPLLQKYARGIKKSFDYLDQDSSLIIETTKETKTGQMHTFKTHTTRRSTLLQLDKTIKQCGYMMSSAEKAHLLKNDHHIVGRKFAIMITDKITVVVPYLEAIIMSKIHKEKCRVLGIESKLRPYLFEDKEAFEKLCHLL